MKKLVIALSYCGLLFLGSCNGCKEVPPAINFGSSKAKDTTYVVNSVPAAQTHNVLIEEFTGEGCSNCPDAHTLLDGLVAAHAHGAINVISLYQNAEGLSKPPDEAHFDLRNEDASAISGSTIYSTNADANYNLLPGAGIDRVPVTSGTSTWLLRTSWTGLVNTRLTTANTINLDVSSTVTGGVATIIVNVTYTAATSTQQNLSIAIVEDSIVDAQEKPFGEVDTMYEFNGVLVDMVTPVPFGDPILESMATKEAGRVVQRVYSYTIPTAFKKGIVMPARCRVIAFVHAPAASSPDFRVYQSQQTKLMGP